MQSLDPTEFQTRRDKIDVALRSSGWDISDSSLVALEVDTKNSDFKAGSYKTHKETRRTIGIEEHAYADYILRDNSGAPLAVIEAKRTSKSATLGQRQAEDYAADIKRQTGNDVFVFFTNGVQTWFWNKPHENPRPVGGFHSREDLERIKFQNHHREDITSLHIEARIVDRPYQIKAVKAVLEGIQRGERKFLIVQATGTGKTRVSMALIDVLLRGDRAQKVLFLADRKALRDQAYSDGFKQFFENEAKSKVVSSNLDKNARLYVSTIQTMMECYEEFSPGAFDVVISDECHRSIYNKWKDVFTYFDAIYVGLTATPSEFVERDTFRFFNCDPQHPTVAYTYEEAVKEKMLVPFDHYACRTHYQIAGIKSGEIPPDIRRQLYDQGIDPTEINFEGTDIERTVVITGTNEAIVKEFMENCLMDSTGTLPAKSIFFAVTKDHANRLWESFERLYPQYKGMLARIITSDDSRAQELLAEFKKQDWPRVAISVDMLNTGVDIPEVCNLVFARPIYSPIEFWQMIGRGTRNDQTCKHKDWLPNGRKEKFRIFDCWEVFEYFKLHPQGAAPSTDESYPSKIFLERLKQLRIYKEREDTVNFEKTKKKIEDDIRSLPQDSIAIRDKAADVEYAKDPRLWQRISPDPIEFLRTRITPLMRHRTGVGLKEAMFLLSCEQFVTSMLEGNLDGMGRSKTRIANSLSCLPIEIEDVRGKEELLDRYLSSSFWQEPTIEDIEIISDVFTPLMKFKREAPRIKIVLDIDDRMERRELTIEYGPANAPQHDSVKNYIEKVENRVRTLADEHPTIRKIKSDQGLTEEDLTDLEKTLNSPELYISEETLRKAYRQGNGTLVQFIRKIIGLYEFPDPEKEIDKAFHAYLVENNRQYSADQIRFIMAIQSVFRSKKHIELSDLYEPPFTGFGSKSPIPMFDEEELEAFINICSSLEKELFPTEV